jgi:hypothetical protein
VCPAALFGIAFQIVDQSCLFRHKQFQGCPDQRPASSTCWLFACMLQRDCHCTAGTPRLQVLAFVDAYLLQSESNELAVWGVGAGTR